MLEFHEDTREVAAVKLGESFEVVLAENPTTGFRWHTRDSGEPVCALAEDQFTPGRAPGGQGVHRWRFRAAQAGDASIQMILQREWTPGAEPAKSFALRVRVAP